MARWGLPLLLLVHLLEHGTMGEPFWVLLGSYLGEWEGRGSGRGGAMGVTDSEKGTESVRVG